MPSAPFATGVTPLNSYGLHVGSVALEIPPSLYFGDYEQSRVIGGVTAQGYGLNLFLIDLLDMSIDVAVGNWPFDFSSNVGLLAQGNASVGPVLPMHVDYSPPYIHLPQRTCDTIVAELPVHYEPSLGLYLWNTSSPQYATIVTNPSFLGFAFGLDGSIFQNMTINVSFSLLKLTLTPPLVSQPTAYLLFSPLSNVSKFHSASGGETIENNDFLNSRIRYSGEQIWRGFLTSSIMIPLNQNCLRYYVYVRVCSYVGADFAAATHGFYVAKPTKFPLDNLTIA